RASRTVPFVSKAIGMPLAKIAAKVMAGRSLAELGVDHEIVPKRVAVKESDYPIAKYHGSHTILGPEMRATDDALGIAESFPTAFLKAQLATGSRLPDKGRVFISVRGADRQAASEVAYRLSRLGFTIVATRGTAQVLAQTGVESEIVNKVYE